MPRPTVLECQAQIAELAARLAAGEARLADIEQQLAARPVPVTRPAARPAARPMPATNRAHQCEIHGTVGLNQFGQCPQCFIVARQIACLGAEVGARR
jgi:hypothetical protein